MIIPQSIIDTDYIENNEVKLINSGAEYFKLLEKIITEAKYFIFLQTYIFDDDATGRSIQHALINSAARNVKIFILIDSFGSGSLPNEFINKLVATGIDFRYYGRYFSTWPFHLGRRLHHKAVVVDGVIALVGGINIADKYNRINDHEPWLDFAVYCKGPVAETIQRVCERKWLKKNIKTVKLRNMDLYRNEHVDSTNNCLAGVRENDFLLNKQQVSKSYRMAFRLAEHDIVIAGGYFVPGVSFRKRIAQAVKRGVRVRIITGAKSDVRISKYARQYLYNWMLGNGIEIYEYQKSVVHAKVAVVDKQWATIGSYDINNLSLSGNIEMNLDVLNRNFAANFHSLLLKTIKENCIHITSEMVIKNSSLYIKLVMWTSYQIVRLFFWFNEMMVSTKRK